MIRRATLPLLLLGAALGLAASSPAGAQGANPFKLKPGAKGKACLACHADFEAVASRPFVHTPVKSGDCADCHDPHASDHGKLLAAEPRDICRSCHAGLVPDKAVSTHAVVARGECAQCHDPHGSASKGNLVAAGNDLCATCHQDLVRVATQARFKHSPVQKGCLTCHDPHASEAAPGLLRRPARELCVGCHKPDQPAFVKDHGGYPVASADCTSCHDPHGSNNRGILWASAHMPLANGMCEECHNAPTSAEPLKVKQPGFQLCRNCHADAVDEMMAKPRLHWPVADQVGCLNCHSPHAGREAKLVRSSSRKLCGSCHASTLDHLQKATVKHAPVEQGECLACHDPHSSDRANLLPAGVMDMCGQCHDWKKHSTHPIGEKAVDRRNANLRMDCLSCHDGHASEFKYFAPFDTKADLCVQCHEEMKR